MTEIPDWVRQLDMAPHPEGGYFRETWRSDLTIAESVLPRTGKATWTHNQAVMELGALVCTARIKHCSACPLRRGCASREDAAVATGRRSA